MSDAYTIRIFVPDGDPEGVRVVDRMNWTGAGIAFPRAKWPEVKQRQEFGKSGVYMLFGYREGTPDDLPTIYVGKAARDIRSRIENHFKSKDFWDTGVVFVSPRGDLNAAHVDWLEYALVERAANAGRCHLDNDNTPQECPLSEAEKADTRAFLKEILQILPLLGIHSLERPKAVSTHHPALTPEGKTAPRDTIVVPAHEDGFNEVFLAQNCWHAIRISGGMLDKIRYIAAYQTAPVGAITHYAEVDRIEPYGEEGKYRLVFSGKAMPIGPINLGSAPKGSMQGPRYTSIANLKAAKTFVDLFK
jgi:hypothetical protein